MTETEVKKCFYAEAESVTKRSDADNQRYLDEHHIEAEGVNVPRPVLSFGESGLPADVLDMLGQNPKFKAPTPIQAQAWPVALQGRDMIGIAQTGSGKTLAFILPAIVHATAACEAGRASPTILVMAPTRELACQIEEETAKFAEAAGLTSLAVYGGLGRQRQGAAIKEGVDILIATPGRLLDFVDLGELDLSSVSYLVLDEADRMLDMGFEPDIRRICAGAPNDARQTLMFSASWPEEVQELAKEFCQAAPVFVQIARENDEDGTTVNKDITQVVEILPDSDAKYDALSQLLLERTKEGTVPQKLLIFVQKKITVDELEARLDEDSALEQKVRFSAQGIHGDKDQRTRHTVLRRFREPLDSKKTRIMIATDVASRGLDVRDISIVVNYDMPQNTEDYVHRIGRTGRAGDKGLAVGFVTSEDRPIARGLVNVLQRVGQEAPTELLDLIDEMGPRRRPRKAKREDDDGDRDGGGGGRREREPMTCFGCGAEGVTKRECIENGGPCADNQGGRGGGGGGGGACYKCGEEGHFARECPNEEEGGGGGRGGGSGGDKHSLFVGNLGFRTQEETIIEFFESAGTPLEVRIAMGDDGRPRGFAHVDFATAEEAQEALKLNGQSLDGRDVRLDLGKGKGGGGGYEGGQASKSRGGQGIWDARPASTNKMADRRASKYDSRVNNLWS